MSERVVEFGDGVRLSGIVTEPSGPGRSTGVVLLGAGLLHRVGPARLHVKLARALAAAGLPTLRFDCSGIGESEIRGDGLTYDQSVVQETQAAMGVLAAGGVERFLLFGICSGADNGMRVAVADDRVVGVAPVALYTFPSSGFRLDTHVRQLTTTAFWRRLARGGVDVLSVARNAVRGLGRSVGGTQNDSDGVAQHWTMPSADHIAASLRSLGARGVHLLLIYTRPSPAEYHYRKFIRNAVKSWGPGAPVRTETFTGTNHTLAPAAHQAKLIDLVVNWAQGVDETIGDG